MMNKSIQELPIQSAAVLPIIAPERDYIPARVIEIELSQPLQALSAIDEKTGRYYQRLLCLVRLHSQPLGLIELQLSTEVMKAQEYIHPIWSSLEKQINEHLHRDGLPTVDKLGEDGLAYFTLPSCFESRRQFLINPPFASIIVATRDRPEQLITCLRSLLALNYLRYEIIVVDNAPSTHATADLVQQIYRDELHVRYTREDHPGTCWARNAGMNIAKGDILAFVDDDVVVDSNWLVELVRAFSLTEDVACVTSLVLPLELETPSQSWFEEYGGFNKGFNRQIFDNKKYHPKPPLYPYAAGQFGTGAGVAFRASFLHCVGGFDPALGPGSLAQGGEDLALFFQVIKRGHKLVYEPSSLLYHLHRRDYASLRKQIYCYGIGLTAYLTKIVLHHPQLLLDFISKVPYGIFFAFSARSLKNNKKSEDYPEELTMLERKGMLYGPVAYIQSRKRVRDVCRGQRSLGKKAPIMERKNGGDHNTDA